jgi:hypothetical protein
MSGERFIYDLLVMIDAIIRFSQARLLERGAAGAAVGQFGRFAATSEALTVTLLTELLRRVSVQNPAVPAGVVAVFEGAYAVSSCRHTRDGCPSRSGPLSISSPFTAELRRPERKAPDRASSA